MSAKARRSRGKHTPQVKKKKGRKSSQAIDRPKVVAPTNRPAAAPIPAATPPVKVPAPSIEYPELTAELARIGVLFAIMLAILVMLTLVLG